MVRPAPLWHEVEVGDVVIQVSSEHPVAVVRHRSGTHRVVSWPDLDVGLRSPSATVLKAPTGAWVFYRPREAQDEAIAPGHAAAIHIGLDGVLTRFDALAPTAVAGTSSHGLWLHPHLSSPDPHDADAWLAEHDVAVLGVDGSRSEIHVDRRVAFVLDGDEPLLLVYSGAPRAVRGRFGGTTFSYRYSRVPLRAGEVPSTLRAGEAGATALDDEALMARFREMATRQFRERMPQAEIDWNAVAMPTDHRESSISAVIEEFADLAEYWRSADGRTGPLSRGLSDPRIDVRGEWPLTRVEVTFQHPHYPGGRLRRSIRVFDDAGRFDPPLYASVHLKEDLDTKALPPVNEARHGVLDS